MKVYVYVLVIAVLVAAVYAAEVDQSEGWHPLQQISLSVATSISVDEDTSFVADNAKDAVQSWTLFPNIDKDNICTNQPSNTNCDARYYTYGDNVSNTDKLGGNHWTAFCLSDGSNCRNMYTLCNETGACEDVYANSVSFLGDSDFRSGNEIEIENINIDYEYFLFGSPNFLESVYADNVGINDLERRSVVTRAYDNDIGYWVVSSDANIIEVRGNLTANSLDVTYTRYFEEYLYNESRKRINTDRNIQGRFSVLYNYGEFPVGSCPSGWTDAGLGKYFARPQFHYSDEISAGADEMSIFARTCTRLSNNGCVALYNYNFSSYDYNSSVSIGTCYAASCPSGWTESYEGEFDFQSCVRTCYKCF